MDEREREYTDAWESEHFPGSSGDIERMRAEAVRRFRVGDLVEITGRDDQPELKGRTGYVSKTDFFGDSEYPVGLTVEGYLGHVWCRPGEIRHTDTGRSAT